MTDDPPPLTGWRRLQPVLIHQAGGETTVKIFWGKLCCLTLALGIAGYLSLVSAVYVYVKYVRGVHQTTYGDLLIPSRWAHQRVVQGNYYIAVAEQEIRDGKPLEALHHLRVGVAKSPGNVQGRLLLARLLASANRFDLAQQVLLDGLPALNSDPSYLQSLFGFLLQQQLDDLTLKISRELLARESPRSERAGIIALAAASACYFRGNYDQAEDFLTANRLDQSYDGRLLLGQIDWERGYRELAVFRLTSLSTQYPANEGASVQLSAWLRELGRNDEFRRLALTRQIANPQSQTSRIDLLYALRNDGETAKIARETAAILREFSRDHSVLVALADYAANTGDAELARQIYDHCKSLGLPWEAPAFLTVESLVVRRDYRGALDLTRDLLKEHPEWAKRYYALFNSLQAVAYYGLGDAASAQLYLANFLGQADLRADNLLAVARRFSNVGARAQARQVLAQASATDPLNQAALTGLIRLDTELGNLTALPDELRRLVAMRKPSTEVLRTAYRKLGSDLFLFSPSRDETLRLIQNALASAASATSRARN
jgi:thioredoxin-like negative regulator of GroEL